ncbi:hypothetical protein Zmor_012714 [Zophobas morio]|uniref:Uncharacterized protein n=1 Tax=Zophobas morio TaxID=2755281 RepID=A0AA38ME03_9CUCU|nr:hypothetical protein Zmor_012714 [Zophobas morio]
MKTPPTTCHSHPTKSVGKNPHLASIQPPPTPNRVNILNLRQGSIPTSGHRRAAEPIQTQAPRRRSPPTNAPVTHMTPPRGDASRRSEMPHADDTTRQRSPNSK